MPRRAGLPGGANIDHKTPAGTDTADFGDREPGNLRFDYVPPSKDVTIRAGGVVWPETSGPLHRLAAMEAEVATSDHRVGFLDRTRP